MVGHDKESEIATPTRTPPTRDRERRYLAYVAVFCAFLVTAPLVLVRVHRVRISNETTSPVTIRVTVFRAPDFEPVSAVLEPAQSTTVTYFRRGQRKEGTFLLEMTAAGRDPSRRDCGYLDLGPTFVSARVLEQAGQLQLICR